VRVLITAAACRHYFNRCHRSQTTRLITAAVELRRYGSSRKLASLPANGTLIQRQHARACEWCTDALQKKLSNLQVASARASDMLQHMHVLLSAHVAKSATCLRPRAVMLLHHIHCIPDQLFTSIQRISGSTSCSRDARRHRSNPSGFQFPAPSCQRWKLQTGEARVIRSLQGVGPAIAHGCCCWSGSMC
jgi:hypothetical protein